ADDRRAHAEIIVVVLRKAVDPPIRQAHGGLEPVALVRQSRVNAVRPREVGRFVRSAGGGFGRLRGNAGGHPPGRGSSPAVRGDEKPPGLRAGEAAPRPATHRARFAQTEGLHFRSGRAVYHAGPSDVTTLVVEA